MSLCEVLQLLFDHLKDVTTTPETLRVLRHQRCPAGPPESHQSPKRTGRKGHTHVPVSRSRGLSEPCKSQPHRGSWACYHQEDFLPLSWDRSQRILYQFCCWSLGGVLFALNIALNSRTKRIKKTTDVKEDTKQVKKGMRRVGQDAEGKKIRNSWKYKKKTPVLALPDCNK